MKLETRKVDSAMINNKDKEELSELIADSKELIAVLTALLEKAETKVDNAPHNPDPPPSERQGASPT